MDVLTLTATPIPRTLHMSLIGIRDMSVLEEPPMDRVPIQTYVMEYNEELVREAITRELARGGQVYYVYNKVRDIDEVTSRIQELVPEANVAFAHGQMRENQLEDIMYRFINGDIDVLVSTTIIETGLDISNVNTMIIHDADNIGAFPSCISCAGGSADPIVRRMRFLCTAETKCSKRWRKNDWLPSGSIRIWAADLRLPCGTWRSGEPEICWEPNRAVTWRRLDMICTARCFTKR